jgi:hypothetical protein
MRLSDLVDLDTLVARWPAGRVRGHGFGATTAEVARLRAWIEDLDRAVWLTDVRPGALAGAAAVEARAQVDTSTTPEGFRFAIPSLPDVELRVQGARRDASDPDEWFIRLFASVTDTDVQVVLEGLPLEIKLPAGLIGPPATERGVAEGVTAGPFRPGHADSLETRFNRDGTTSIFVHVRLHLDENGDIFLRPAVPVCFGPCTLFDLLPCRALYDVNVFPHPARVHDRDVDWIRHDITPFFPVVVDGQLAIRSVYFDYEADPIRSITSTLNNRRTSELPQPEPPDIPPNPFADLPENPYLGERAPAGPELVLDDLVIPLAAFSSLPIPRHLTVGVRRTRNRLDDPHEAFDFTRAPVALRFASDPGCGFYIERLFFASPEVALHRPTEEVVLAILSSIQLAAGFWFERESGRSDAIEIALGENVTPRIGYRRDIGPGSDPADLEPEEGTIDAALHFPLGEFMTLDIIAIRIGYSFGRLAETGRGESGIEVLLDVLMTQPPDEEGGGDDSVFKLVSLGGEPLATVIEGVGWKDEQIHVEGVASPDGAKLVIADTVAIVVREISMLADQGATYVSISAGVELTLSGLTGRAEVRRMRIRVAGNPLAPMFNLDGLFLALANKEAGLAIEFGGFFTDESIGEHRRKEFGLAGSVTFKVGDTEWRIGAGFLFGKIRSLIGSTAPEDNFDYLMIMLSLRGSLVIAMFELRGVQVLFAWNMQPRLGEADRQAGELRYYNWYKTGADPLNVPVTEMLEAWEPQVGAWALGVGAQASFAQMGKFFELGIFVLGVSGPDENGLMIAAEIRLMGKPRPIGWAVFEYDGRNDTFSLLAGIDITIGHFVDDPPPWLMELVRLSGTLFIGNRPVVIAIGRLRDLDSWLALRFRLNLGSFARLVLEIALCLELDFSPEGVRGFGLIVRFEGALDVAIIAIELTLGFGFTIAFFNTGSDDVAVAIWIEGAIRVVLLGFLRFGVSARAEYRFLGSSPDRHELEAEIRIETPWFLPDIEFTVAWVSGELVPEGLGASVAPLRLGAANEPGSRRTFAVHHERFDVRIAELDPAARWDGVGTSSPWSVIDLRRPAAPELDRTARFDASRDLAPVATDAEIAIDFSVPVDDGLALDGTGVAAAGTQTSGDLTLRYEVIGYQVRRRPRFGADRGWEPVDTRRELPLDFSDPAGAELAGSFAPQVLTTRWDLTAAGSGEQLAKKLLINAETPFEFATRDHARDEQLVRANPAWPCCPAPEERVRRLAAAQHEADFRTALLGAATETTRTFSASDSTLRLLRPYAVVVAAPTGLPAGTQVAAFRLGGAATIARAVLDEDAVRATVRLAWDPAPADLAVLAFDANGDEVARVRRSLATGSSFVDVAISGRGPIRTFELHLLVAQAPPTGAAYLYFDRAAYLGVDDYRRELVQEAACEERERRGDASAAGAGKVFFLPNHEYELGITTRVTISHPSVPEESAEVTEHVAFRTKGLPGLNAVTTIGEEVTPYTESIYTGGRGVLYREEPVAVAYDERLSIVVPYEARRPGTGAEWATLLRYQLLVRPEVAVEAGTPMTTGSTDWIVEHRRPVLEPLLAWRRLDSASWIRARETTSTNPQRHRLADLTERPEVTCALPDPRVVTGSVLIAPPQGDVDPDHADRELWLAGRRYAATVVASTHPDRGTPHVARDRFVAEDATAFRYVGATGADVAAWSIDDGMLRAPGAAALQRALFGEATWNHVTVRASIAVGATTAGVATAIADPASPRAILALVERSVAPGRVVLYRHTGDALEELAAAPLAAGAGTADTPTELVVDLFDDRLRARVGEVTIEADRGELRDGQLALVGDGGTGFAALAVAGIPVQVFSFQTSRYRSFEAHIGSFSGRIDVAGPDLLGAGTTRETVASLRARTATAIAAAMTPEAPEADRQRLFEEWIGQLGLALKEEVPKLELTRFAQAGRADLLLLESPEPLDFVQEVRIRVTRRQARRSGPARVLDRLRDRIGDLIRIAVPGFDPRDPAPPVPIPRVPTPPGPGPRPLPFGAKPRVRDLLDAALDRGASGPKATPEHALEIVDAIERPGGLDVTILGKQGLAGELIFARRSDDGSGGVELYRAIMGKPSGTSARAGAAKVHATRMDAATIDMDRVRHLIPDLRPGAIAALDPRLGGVLGPHSTVYEWVEVTLTVLQDATSRRALIIPAAPLGAGTHRLRFQLDRARWRESEPAAADASYRRELELSLEL